MSNEEFERYKNFILEQQAQSATKIGQLEETMTRLTTEIIAPFIKATLDRFEATDKRIDNVDERISALVDSQIRTEGNLTRLEENLRNLIAVVDRYFSEGRNGNPKG